MTAPHLDPQEAFRQNMTAQRKSDALYAFIKSELAEGRPFPTHQAMQDYIGASCYAQAVLDLVLRGLIVRERCTKFGRKTKYTYRLAERTPTEGTIE